jgi:hypothetical protein
MFWKDGNPMGVVRRGGVHIVCSTEAQVNEMAYYLYPHSYLHSAVSGAATKVRMKMTPGTWSRGAHTTTTEWTSEDGQRVIRDHRQPRGYHTECEYETTEDATNDTKTRAAIRDR